MRTAPKTSAQIRAIFGLGRSLNCEKADLEELANDVTGGRVSRLSELNFKQANAIIERLGGSAFAAAADMPRRTASHRRRVAGVKQIAQPSHLELMEKLAAGRSITPEGLERMCRRMLSGRSRPLTTEDTNKIIEALKAMNRRAARSKEAA